MKSVFSFVFVSLLLALPAHGKMFQVCNRAHAEIDVAYVVWYASGTYYLPDSTFMASKGWQSIPAGRCHDFHFFSRADGSDNVYAAFHARYELGGDFGGKNQYCVLNGEFSLDSQIYNNADRCRARGGRMVGFSTHTSHPLTFSDPNSYVRACNRSQHVQWTADGMFRDNTWQTNGWRAVQPGACANIRLGQFRGDFYLGGFASVNGGRAFWGGGNAQFCVDFAQSFNYRFADSMNCTGPTQIRLNMYRINFNGPGLQTFNMN